MGLFNTAIAYDGVYSAVQSLLDSGKTLDDISLRDIRSEMGDRGSLSTIAKHFGPIKVRLARGEALNAVELSETDMDALRTLVRDIIERRTFLERKEKEDSAQAMSDVIRAHEADLAMKDEAIDDLEQQVSALEDESSAQTLVIKDLNAQVARLMGKVEALNATIATLAPHRDTPARAASAAAKEQPPAIVTTAPESGQVSMSLDTSVSADEPDDAGGDRG